MIIYSILKSEHRAAKALLVQLTQPARHLNGNQRQKILKKLRAELRMHDRAEEVAFYSRLIQSQKSRVLIVEGKREHALIEEILGELSMQDGMSDEFTGLAKVLRDLVEHHIEEEETEIHKQARKELSHAEAEEIGEEFLALKKSYSKDKEFIDEPYLIQDPVPQISLLMQRGQDLVAKQSESYEAL